MFEGRKFLSKIGRRKNNPEFASDDCAFHFPGDVHPPPEGWTTDAELEQLEWHTLKELGMDGELAWDR